MPGGIKLEKYDLLRPKKKKVIFVSRSMYYKGLVPFLDAIPLIIKEHQDVEIFAHMTLDTNSLYFDDQKSTFLSVDKTQHAGDEEFDSF